MNSAKVKGKMHQLSNEEIKFEAISNAVAVPFGR